MAKENTDHPVEQKDRRPLGTIGALCFLGTLLAAAVIFLIYGRMPPWVLGLPAWLKYLLMVFSDPDGLRFAITATGVVSFALTYINSARVHRVKGILLGKVIHKCYPMYGFFFLLHGAFVILGIYSCAVKVRAAGALSALGVLLCLIYAVNLALHTTFNSSYKEKLVKKYIVQVINHGKHEEQYESVCTVAQYIGKRFSSEGWLFDPNFGASGMEDDMDRLLELLEKVIPASAKGQSELGLLSDFDQIFALKDVPSDPEYVLFSIPAVKVQKADFQKAVDICGNMWRSLLDELTEWPMQAKLAYLMLCRAGLGQGNQRRSSMAALCCGLLFYLHTPALSNFDHAGDVPKAGTGNVSQDSSVHCAYILQQINYLRVQPTDRESTKRQYLIRAACRDMGIVGLCLSALEQTFATQPVDHEAMLRVIYEVERGRETAWDRQSIYQYLCFAQIIASLNHYSSNRFHALQTVPLIYQAVKQWLSGGLKKCGKVDVK